MKIDGSCHCGRIRFEAEVDPETVVICHCTDCQTLSGTTFRTVVPTKQGTFKLLSGEIKIYEKVAESGNTREQTFCPNCGTPIYSAPVGPENKVVSLRVGAIRQRDRLIPSDQFWARSAQCWLKDLPTVPAREKQPTFGPSGNFSQ